jgi:hypothetical protein
VRGVEITQEELFSYRRKRGFRKSIRYASCGPWSIYCSPRRGRDSIQLERLLRTSLFLLQMLFSIPSGQQFVEDIDFNLLTVCSSA